MPSIALPVSLRGQLLSGTRTFSPASLFSANEPGVWFDPSDVANLNWRVNLLTWTEQFDNPAWTAANATVTANAATAPDGTTTAEVLTPNTLAARHYVRQGSLFPGYTLSVYAKANVGSLNLWLGDDAIGARVFFNLTNGTIASGSGGAIEAAGNGWYRCSILNVTSGGITSGNQPWIGASVGTNQTAASNGTDSILIWGAQLQTGSVATDYQRISDVNTEVLERFPNTTLYQDSVGTAPVTTPGQTVGLMLDKSKGLVLGTERVVNGDFSAGTTGWATFSSATISVVGGRLQVVDSAGYSGTDQTLSVGGTNKTVRFNFDAQSGVAELIVQVYDAALGTLLYNQNVSAGASVSRSVLFNTLSFSSVRILIRSLNASTFFLDNISIKELPGNHATQATLAARPTYAIEPAGGRRNLLVQTEDLTTGGGWSFTTATSVGGATDPNLGTTAFTLTATANNANILRASNANTIGTQYTNSFYIRRVNGTGAITLYKDTGAETAITLTSSWTRYSTTWTATGTNGYIGVKLAVSGDVIQIWHPQQELGSTATNYQRVTTQYDVTEAGKPTMSYLYFDGVNDAMVTSTITPGTDKVQVFTGVRKLVDSAGYQIIAELSTDVGSAGNPGSFVLAPATGTHEFFSKGTAVISAVASGYAAPITNVVTGLGDISGDRTTIRMNSAQITQSTGDQGAGNYLAYPLYIGARAGASLFFNGRLYSLITRFGANLDTPSITSTEIWVGDKTGIDVAKNISTTIYTRSGDTILDRANSTIERRAV